MHHARTERIVNVINAKMRFLAQTKGRRERERERKRKGKEKRKGKLEVGSIIKIMEPDLCKQLQFVRSLSLFASY